MAGLDVADLETYKLATEAAVVFDLSRHGLISCTGKDSAQFLHNLCTNEVVKLPLGHASEAFLTTAQAAFYVNLSRRTLEKMRTVGGGPKYRKHGRYVRYHIDDLDSWSASRTRRSTSDP